MMVVGSPYILPTIAYVAQLTLLEDVENIFSNSN